MTKLLIHLLGVALTQGVIENNAANAPVAFVVTHRNARLRTVFKDDYNAVVSCHKTVADFHSLFLSKDYGT